eukprot:2631849-Rhodomonas_salina.1
MPPPYLTSGNWSRAATIFLSTFRGALVPVGKVSLLHYYDAGIAATQARSHSGDKVPGYPGVPGYSSHYTVHS